MAMEEHRKKRITGIVFVTVAALILAPWLLTGEGYKERQLTSAMPKAPEAQTWQAIEPETQLLPDTREVAPVKEIEPTTVVSVETAAESTKELESKKPEAAPVQEAEKRPVIGTNEPAPAIDQQGVPVAWTLQLASFKDEANARALRKQLIGAGYKVYTQRQTDIYRVYVGPELKKERLESLKENLKGEYGLDGMIIRFSTQ
jgi:DedD protein